MAPQGQYTRSRHCFLGMIVAVVATLLISMALFREELLSAFRNLQPQACSCSATDPAAVSLSPAKHTYHQGHGKPTVGEEQQGSSMKQHQPLLPTTFADLTILEDLAPANVLWVNETSAGPEAWGISMFHALHCVKMWKETLDPATTMASHVHGESEYAEHAGHCINYLVQVGKNAITGTRCIKLTRGPRNSQSCVLPTAPSSRPRMLWTATDTGVGFTAWATSTNAVIPVSFLR